MSSPSRKPAPDDAASKRGEGVQCPSWFIRDDFPVQHPAFLQVV